MKYTLVLKNIDTKALGVKYELKTAESTDNVTNISEIIHEITYTDCSKRVHKCITSVINPNNSGYHCFWCRNPFEGKSYYCPTRYVPNIISKTYYSEIIKDNNTIREYTTKDGVGINATEANDYYESDGIFCSPNCRKAFIIDNKHNKLYTDSEYLTKLIGDGLDVSPAPSWRLLKEYGGHLTIDEFRNTFNRMDYESHGIYKPLHHVFEEKLKF